MILRRDLLQHLLLTLDAGESGVLIGASSMGKSRLLRMLEKEEVRQTIHQSLQKEKAPAPPTLYAFVDFNRLHGQEDWLYYEIMLNALLRALDKWAAHHQEHQSRTVLERLEHLYEQVVRSKDSLLALRYLERGLGFLVGEFKGGVVFLMDEADAVIQQAPASFFRTLKAIRDEYKYRVRYLVSLRDEIARIRENVDDIEPFYEHVTLHVFYVGPHSKEESLEALKELYERHRQPWDESQAQKLVILSGGHPGLLRELHAWLTQGKKQIPERPEELLAINQIWQECTRLWQSLREDEQGVLLKVVRGEDLEQVPISARQALINKGILVVVKEQPFRVRLFSPLFEAFTQQFAQTEVQGIRIDGGRVWIDGREIQVSSSEFRLLEYLVKHAGEVCERETLMRHIYEDDYYGSTDFRLDSLIYRLREKIEPDRRRPRYLVTVRGRGFRWDGPVVKTDTL